MNIPIFHVDAFADKVFSGNPAAVCPLENWFDDATLQAIAKENNLSETAFFVPNRDGFHLRWFTPKREVELCGHATLASAWVIVHHIQPGLPEVRFDSLSGPLKVSVDGDSLTMDFPASPGRQIEAPLALLKGLKKEPLEVYEAMYYMAVFETEDEIAALDPDFATLNTLDRELIVTAQGNEVDFVSRFFAPQSGIPEDPVTGSAHCVLTPYWSKQLGKRRLTARQISERGGNLLCEDRGDRVAITGTAVEFFSGEIRL